MKYSLGLLIGILTLPAFGASVPFRSDDILSRATTDARVDTDIRMESDATIARSAARTTASRAVPATSESNSGRNVSSVDGRVVASRGGLVTDTITRQSNSDRATVARIASDSRALPARATTVQTTSRTTSNDVSSRVGFRSVNSGPASTMSKVIGSRVPTIRVASANSVPVAETTLSTQDTLKEMNDLAEMADFCKAQYGECMDNYCNVLDDNQGRCSCSANLKNYAKAESALKAATEELQDVAQKIQYIGLTSREIETLFSETEAELTMSSKTDNSSIKTSLDKIKDMLIEVRPGTSSVDTLGDNFGFDLNGLLDFTIDSNGFDLNSFLSGFGTNTASVKNQRGEELYKTAVSRCKAAVLKSCSDKGVDINLITNSYDLQIDKECILYERSLTDSNDQMVSTVRNAKSVLQKARLMVSQQKNAYDMRGCINALDACMQDEFVCGTDYENCLDPTGRYIVNGEIVLGSQPGHAIDPKEVAGYASGTNSANSVMTNDVCAVNLYRTWDITDGSCTKNASFGADSGNAWGMGPTDTLAKYIDASVTSTAAQSPSTNIAKFLQNKIGYVDNTGRSMGMCISVLNKCQNYTYEGTVTNSKYNPLNEVIKQYLARTLVQIKAKQDAVLSEYADSCVSDVVSCLSQNNYPSTAQEANDSTIANIAINACRPTIVTCMSVTGYSIETPTPTEMVNWVFGLSFPDPYYNIQYNCGEGTEAEGADMSTRSVRAGAKFTVLSGALCKAPDAKTFKHWGLSVTGESKSAQPNTPSDYEADTCAKTVFAGNSIANYCWKSDITLTAEYQ